VQAAIRKVVRAGMPVLVVAVLFAAIVPVQRRLTSEKTDEWLQQRMSYLPRSDILKPLLLGFHTTYANYLWFRTVNYFGTHYITDRSYPWLVQMVDMVTRLNPYFEPAYEFAGVLLPDLAGAPDAAEVILRRGIENIGSWSHKPYLYAGVLRLKYWNDRVGAAEYIGRGALVPTEHAWKMARMAATFYTQAGEQLAARDYLVLLLETSDNPAVKRVVEDKMRELENEH